MKTFVVKSFQEADGSIRLTFYVRVASGTEFKIGRAYIQKRLWLEQLGPALAIAGWLITTPSGEAIGLDATA